MNVLNCSICHVVVPCSRLRHFSIASVNTATCIVFKNATLVYLFLSGNAPGYLADNCQLVADARVRQLRSADTQTLVVSRTRSSFGDRTFAAAGPQVWNSLPLNLRLRWTVIRPVQVVTEDIFIWTVRP